MELDALYQDVILDHNRSPRNYGALSGTDAASASGRNPLCGDEVTVWIRMEDDRVAEISFEGTGCAISKASASMMTQAVKGLTRDEAEALFSRFHTMVTGGAGDAAKELGKLRAFGGVSRFPTRVKCASLAWHALHDALPPR